MSFLNSWQEKALASFDDWFDNESGSRCDQDLRDDINYDYFNNKFEEDWEEHCLSHGIDTNDDAKKDDFGSGKLKEKAKEYFEETWVPRLYERLIDNLEFSDDDHVKIYRKITIKHNDYEKFISGLANNKFLYDKNGIGSYWAMKESAAECHWSGHSGGLEICLVGIIPVKSINIDYTVSANLSLSCGYDEQEINLTDSSQDNYIQIIKINNDNVDLLVLI